MTLLKDPGKMLFLLLIALAILIAFIIARNGHNSAYHHQKVGRYSEMAEQTTIIV